MGDLLGLIVGVQMSGRGGESGMGSATQHHPVLIIGHLLDERPGLLAERLARHASTDGHHDVDNEIAIGVDDGVAVDLKKTDRPLLVQDAKAGFTQPLNRLGLARPAMVETSNSSPSVGM